MARAKRTNRAEARRRYRARMAAGTPGGDEAPDRDPADAPAPPARQAAARRGSDQDLPPRPGIGNAFRAAFRPANVREDLAVLPSLLRHRSVWLPAAISIATTALFLATGGTDVISYLLAQYFISPPIGAIFLSGFLAPRASYLTGAIAGLVGAICLLVLAGAIAAGALGPPGGPTTSPSPGASPSAAAGSPAPSASAAPTAAPSASLGASVAPSPAAPGGVGNPPLTDPASVTFALVLWPVMGVFLGAAAAWYRRFLRFSSPPRRQQPARGKGSQRRR